MATPSTILAADHTRILTQEKPESITTQSSRCTLARNALALCKNREYLAAIRCMIECFDDGTMKPEPCDYIGTLKGVAFTKSDLFSDLRVLPRGSDYEMWIVDSWHWSVQFDCETPAGRLKFLETMVKHGLRQARYQARAKCQQQKQSQCTDSTERDAQREGEDADGEEGAAGQAAAIVESPVPRRDEDEIVDAKKEHEERRDHDSEPVHVAEAHISDPISHSDTPPAQSKLESDTHETNDKAADLSDGSQPQ